MNQPHDNESKLPIVYFGSGPLAAKSLEFLHPAFTLEAVITKPRPAHHKGAVPVIDYCEAHGIPYFTPANKQELSDLCSNERFKSRLGVVIDYGIIINRDVIDIFPLGIVNSHFSLLPEWRGPDPITFAILSGQTKTGVSLMLINEKMDEGLLLAQAATDIGPTTTAITLTDELIDISNGLLLEILPLYDTGVLQPVPQASSISSHKTPSYSRKLTKQDGVLDWDKPAEQLEREVRAFIEWPKSRTTIGQIEVIVMAAHSTEGRASVQPGHIAVLPSKHTIKVSTARGYFYVDKLKPAGKKEMTTAEFLRGYGARLPTD